MKTLYQLLLISCLAVTNAFGQMTFEKTYGDTVINTAYSFVSTYDNGYILAGNNYSPSSGYKGYHFLIKTDAAGDTVWEKHYSSGSFGPLAVLQTQDSGYLFAGAGFNSSSIFVMKTDKFGDTSWVQRDTSSLEAKGTAPALIYSAEGNYVLAGSIEESSHPPKGIVRKLDQNGSRVWQTEFLMPSRLNDVRLCTDNGFIATGWYYNSSPNILLAKLGAAGNIEWSKTFPFVFEDIGQSVRQTADGGYAIACNADSILMLIKTDNVGNIEWQKQYLNGLSPFYKSYGVVPCTMDLTNDGGFIFIVNKKTSSYLLRLNSQGDSLWSREFTGLGNTAFNSVRSMPDNGFAMSGYTYASSTLQYAYFVKTDSLGITAVKTISRPKNHWLLVSPNPVAHQLTIYNPSVIQNHSSTLFITNTVGQTLYQSGITNPQSEIDISFLPPGIYFAEVVGEKERWVGRFVKE